MLVAVLLVVGYLALSVLERSWILFPASAVLACISYPCFRFFDKWNLSVFHAPAVVLALFHPRTYLVFKKCNFTSNPYFWHTTNWSKYYYMKHCDEHWTLQNIYRTVFTFPPRQITNLFVECFGISLFLNEENKAALLLTDHYTSTVYAISTQRWLERKRNSGEPIPALQDKTPDLFIQHLTEKWSLIIDITETEDVDRAWDEKRKKYEPLGIPLVVLFYSPVKSKFSYRAPGLPNAARSFLEQEFSLRFAAKIMKADEDVGSRLKEQYKVLQQELSYWQLCLDSNKIIKSNRH